MCPVVSSTALLKGAQGWLEDYFATKSQFHICNMLIFLPVFHFDSCVSVTSLDLVLISGLIKKQQHQKKKKNGRQIHLVTIRLDWELKMCVHVHFHCENNLFYTVIRLTAGQSQSTGDK